MRVELIDPLGRPYVIETMDYDLITKWLDSFLPMVLKESDKLPWSIRVWASTTDEGKLLEVTHSPHMLLVDANAEGFKKLENYFRRASGRDKRNGKR